MMKTSDFNFDLPQELIAQDPLEDRSSSRLMVLNKESGEITHRIFHDITEYLQPGDCLVINDTKVIQARLIGTKMCIRDSFYTPFHFSVYDLPIDTDQIYSFFKR